MTCLQRFFHYFYYFSFKSTHNSILLLQLKSPGHRPRGGREGGGRKCLLLTRGDKIFQQTSCGNEKKADTVELALGSIELPCDLANPTS